METKRLIIFTVFIFSILTIWQKWSDRNHPSVQNRSTAVETMTLSTPQQTGQDEPYVHSGSSKTIKVNTDLFHAEIDTQGGDIRLLQLLRYQHSDKDNNKYELFHRQSTSQLLMQAGFTGGVLPTHNTLYESEKTEYQLRERENQLPVHLTWKTSEGVNVNKTLVFHRGSYVIDVIFSVTNHSHQDITPSVYYQILHDGKLEEGSRFIPSFSGVGYFTEEKKYQKLEFSDVDKEAFSIATRSGWVGFVQRYFLTVWLPGFESVQEFYARKNRSGTYTIGTLGTLGAIHPGKTATSSCRLYAGPQLQEKLKEIEPRLERTVDYGWLTIIASPLFWLLAHIERMVGNWGTAIILLTILIKVAFFPLSATSYRSMTKMKDVAPRLAKLKEKYGDDRQQLNQAMMEIYKAEKINPMSGCLPILVQIPVFIALYWVLVNSVELRQAPFIFWIKDLSIEDPYYVLPVLMAISMVVQTLLNPKPVDPIQAKMMMAMPIVFSVFFFFSPAGLVLYWFVNNVISIAQQKYIDVTIRSTSDAAR